MLLCGAGDIHGAIDRLYADVGEFESALGSRFEWVLHVGDFGVWPDPDRVDKATRKHDGAGDFPSWFAERRAVPRKTIFIKGNHEDFVWLDSQNREEILPGLYAKRHYTRNEIDDLCRHSGIDVLLVHDAPAGVKFERHRRGAGYVSEAAGLDDLISRVRPRVCFFGHHHTRLDAEVAGIRCVGLNKVAMPGNLVAVELETHGRGWSLLGEWPPRP